MNNLHFKTINELSKLIKSKAVSPVAVTEACLARIDQLNPAVNAFITVLAEQARAQAKQAEQQINSGEYRGPLHGIPVAFKDMYDTEGVKTTAAFKYFKNRVPQKDAAAVAKLKQAGAVIIGKTNMHELAMGTTSTKSAYGEVHNPWDVDRIAAGSSGGSAAAVALGMCFATVDTDAIGSTRLPASCCGVVGYKCTWGMIDNSGILDGEKAEDYIIKLASTGIMTRDVTDTALVADALAGKQLAKTISQKPSLTIGVVSNFGASDDLREAFNKAVASLKKLGYKTANAEAPFDQNPNMAAITESRKGADQKIFSKADVLVLPTTATAVPKINEVGKDPQAFSPQNTFFANYFGLPAITVPAGTDQNNMPAGLQIVAKTNQDAALLQLAHDFQTATKWHQQHPTDPSTPAKKGWRLFGK